ncbi:MAG: DUF3108 domain-containing protein [Pyrinomonadaceae bacterium]
MKRPIFTFSILLTMLFSAVFVFGQTNGSPVAASFPFASGETLHFEGKLNKFVSVTIGDLTFKVNDADKSRMRFTIDARSRGTLMKLFRYSFTQEIDTFADANKLFAISSTKHDVQKQRVRNSITDFDYDRRMVTWIESNPDEPTNRPRTIASDLEGPTHDIVSAIYYLRTLPLAVGYSTTINISDSGLVYKIPVKVLAREREKTIFGNIWCYRVEPELFGPGRFFEQKGKMEIWLSDDARRIPIRAKVNAEVGKVEIRLKDATNLK